MRVDELGTVLEFPALVRPGNEITPKVEVIEVHETTPVARLLDQRMPHPPKDLSSRKGPASMAKSRRPAASPMRTQRSVKCVGSVQHDRRHMTMGGPR